MLMMMEPETTDLLRQILIHLGFGLGALAFLVRDILWLRLLAIGANLCVGFAAYRSPAGPVWEVVGWSSAFVAINSVHSIWLLYERHLMRFTAEEKALKDSAFQAVDPAFVKKLFRRGQWVDFEPQDCLARQGVHLDRLILVSEGEAAVCLGGAVVAKLGQGKFVGEISILTGEQATATVLAAEKLRCMVWKKDALKRIEARRPELYAAFYAAIGKDLATKIAGHNVKLSQV